MTEYIKLKDAIRAMAQYLMEIGQCKSDIATSVMSKVKAADVIEVVRCKDCKHYKRNVPCVYGHYNGCELSGLMVELEHYCSYGERKEE